MLKIILKLFEGLNSDNVSDVKGLNEMNIERFYLTHEATILANQPIFYLRASFYQNIVGLLFLFITHKLNAEFFTVPLFMIFDFFFMIYSMLYFGTVVGSIVKPLNSKRSTLKCQRKLQVDSIISEWFRGIALAFTLQAILYIVATFYFGTARIKFVACGLIVNWGLHLIIYTLRYLFIKTEDYVEFDYNATYCICFKNNTRKEIVENLEYKKILITDDSHIFTRDKENQMYTTSYRLFSFAEIDCIKCENIVIKPDKEGTRLTIE